MVLSDISCAYLALDQLLASNNNSDKVYHSLQTQRHIEVNKSQTYQDLVSAGVPMPLSRPFNSAAELVSLSKNWPCVVKFNSSMTLGIQTTVIQNSLQFKDLIFSIKHVEHCQGLVQQFITGSEHTVTVLVGKHNWIPIGYARDYKKQFEHDRGLNTFGLGSICIPSTNTNHIIDAVVDTLKCCYQYQGFLSCQFIQDQYGKFWLLECNTRLCDPEFQSMAETLNQGLDQALEQCYTGQCIEPLDLNSRHAITISLVHQDWPNAQLNRYPLSLSHTNFKIRQHRGAWDRNTYWGSITNSGYKSNLELAQQVYDWLGAIDVVPYRYRKDIGQ